MKKLKIGLFVGVALALGGGAGCMSTPPSPIGFNYQVDNGQANRIVQVFDLSGNTVVQIRNVDTKATRFYSAQNVEIPFKVMGENVDPKWIAPELHRVVLSRSVSGGAYRARYCCRGACANKRRSCSFSAGTGRPLTGPASKRRETARGDSTDQGGIG